MMFAPAHPNWCDPERCDVSDPTLGEYRGAHRSHYEVLDDLAPLVIGQDRLQVANVYLWQAAGPYRPTLVVFDSAFGSIQMPLLKAAGYLIKVARLIGMGEVSV